MLGSAVKSIWKTGIYQNEHIEMGSVASARENLFSRKMGNIFSMVKWKNILLEKKSDLVSISELQNFPEFLDGVRFQFFGLNISSRYEFAHGRDLPEFSSSRSSTDPFLGIMQGSTMQTQRNQIQGTCTQVQRSTRGWTLLNQAP